MNTETKSQAVPKRRHEISYALLVFTFSTLFCLLLAEYGLRWYQQRIDSSSTIDPGLLRYDARLGWTLAPLWQGRHRHHDFDVAYTINARGFRDDALSDQQDKDRTRIAVVGDSFSFGLGVNDADTFTAKLNHAQDGAVLLNLSVPGYSTDQELLLMESRGSHFRPDAYLLVVYLGNDLLDNMLSYPLQAEQAKPFFRLDDAGVPRLQNVPVPTMTKPAALRAVTLESVIFGESLQQKESMSVLRDTQLWQRLLGRRGAADRHTVFDILDQRLDAQKKLMRKLLERAKNFSDGHDARLQLVLLSGSSFVLAPESYSAYFQDYVRLFLQGSGEELGLTIIDVADRMRRLHSPAARRWYYPNEGHLTVAGHQQVSSILIEALELE